MSWWDLLYRIIKHVHRMKIAPTSEFCYAHVIVHVKNNNVETAWTIMQGNTVLTAALICCSSKAGGSLTKLSKWLPKSWPENGECCQHQHDTLAITEQALPFGLKVSTMGYGRCLVFGISWVNIATCYKHSKMIVIEERQTHFKNKKPPNLLQSM